MSVDIRLARYGHAIPAWANREHIRAIYKLAKQFGYHVDHIVPIHSPLVCGLHCRDNFQFLKANSNIKKSNRHWPDMPMEQEELLPFDPGLLQTRLIP